MPDSKAREVYRGDVEGLYTTRQGMAATKVEIQLVIPQAARWMIKPGTLLLVVVKK